MDELLIVVLFSALTGVMIGSLGTVVIFWLCGALERKTVIEKVSPELSDATIQAEYVCTPVGMKTLFPIFENSCFLETRVSCEYINFWSSSTFCFCQTKTCLFVLLGTIN